LDLVDDASREAGPGDFQRMLADRALGHAALHFQLVIFPLG
jgi:hypothetical protein